METSHTTNQEEPQPRADVLEETQVETIEVTGSADVSPVDLPEPFGALKIWLSPSKMGAEYFREENLHGRR